MSANTIGFLLPSAALAGGVHVVLRWAQILGRAGHSVYVLGPGFRRVRQWPFLEGEALHFVGLDPIDVAHVQFDVLFGTWWQTLFDLPSYHCKHHALFAQALEEQFYAYDAHEQRDYQLIINSGVPIITIAHWLRDHFAEHFAVPADKMSVVLNPLDRARFVGAEPLVPKGERPRFLVEGRHNEARKNVPRTLRLLERTGAEYIWVGAAIDRSLVGPHCVAVLEQLPYSQMPRVYASCDVLVKLSDAEGMFGPPLEMFASGGTAITWNVPGREEYMTHRFNALVTPMHSDDAVERAVRELCTDWSLLERLKTNALRTANNWPEWSQIEAQVLAAVDGVMQHDSGRFLERAAYLRAGSASLLK